MTNTFPCAKHFFLLVARRLIEHKFCTKEFLVSAALRRLMQDVRCVCVRVCMHCNIKCEEKAKKNEKKVTNQFAAEPLFVARVDERPLLV